MAVPVPAAKRPRGLRNPLPIQGAVRLEYPGKMPAEAILGIAPRQYQLMEGAGPDRLYFADNLGVLATLASDPEVAGKVRLAYLDPPYATAGSFESRTQIHAYDDALVGPEFIESLRARLLLLHRLLADDGSLYLHLDERMAFHFRVVLDEIFGPKQYRNLLVRKKCNPKNSTRSTYGNVADYLLFYTKGPNAVWNRPIEPWDEARAHKEYQYVDAEGRRYKKVPDPQ